jgi:hypothetical protein
VHKLDLPCKDADSAAGAAVAACGMDHAENSEVDRRDNVTIVQRDGTGAPDKNPRPDGEPS